MEVERNGDEEFVAELEFANMLGVSWLPKRDGLGKMFAVVELDVTGKLLELRFAIRVCFFVSFLLVK